MRIVIGVPSGDMVHAGFAFDLVQMVAYTQRVMPREIQLAVINEQGSLIHQQRHNLVVTALKLQAEYLLFLDSDMRFPAETLCCLLKVDKPVVAVNAVKRRPPHEQTAVGFHNAGLCSRVERIGTAVMLINMMIFRQVNPPYFKSPWVDDKFRSEDYDFCERLKILNYPIYCHNRLSELVRHTGTKNYGLEDSDALQSGEAERGSSVEDHQDNDGRGSRKLHIES